MKFATSVKNASIVAGRISASSGIIETPEGNRQAVRIKRAWLFGSTARGSACPNDTDIILDICTIGFNRSTNTHRGKKMANHAKTDKRYKRNHGISVAMNSHKIATKYLYKDLKMVRIHDLKIDGEYATERIMIYPKNDLEFCKMEK